MSEPVSIRGRLLAILALLFGAGMLALYAAATSYARYAADSSYDRLLLGSAGSIAETLTVSPSDVRVDIPYAALDMLSAAPDDRVFYRVIGADGKTITGYGDLPLAGGPNPGPRLFDAEYRGEQVRFAALSKDIRREGVSGRIWIEVGQTRIARSGLARELTIRALLPILGMTLIAGLAVWVGVGRAMRPLERIGARLSRREPSDLSPLGFNSPQEIRPLTDALDDFMGRLAKTMDVLKVFIADAAHQLRTPITALLLQMRAAQTSRGEARVRHLADAQSSAERLARLVDQLLGDAMVVHRAQLGHRIAFDLASVVEQAVHDCRPLMGDADLRMAIQPDAPQVVGDPVQVGEAIKNVLHNALVHTAATTDDYVTVLIGLAAAGDMVEVSVADNGPGMAEADLAAIGDRFRDSRSPHRGSGIGLAITREVMAAQRGRLDIGNRADGPGLRVVMSFPAA